MSLLVLLKGAGAVSAPTNTSAPVISGITQVGQTLQATVGAWANNPTSYAFQWQSAATIGGAYTNIGGATTQSFLLTSAQIGLFVRVQVTATNSGGSATATSNSLGAITTAPVVTQHFAAPRPALTLAADFTNAALTGSPPPPIWTDLSPYVRGSLSVKRGRANLLDKVEGGTFTGDLNNDDRRFEAEYPASPYYPYVTPMRRLRFQAVYNGVIYNLHIGYVQSWPLDWPSFRRATTAVTSTDAFERLTQTKLSGVNDPTGQGLLVINGAVSGAYIDSVLNLAQWDQSARSDGNGGTIFAAGKETLIGVEIDYTTPTASLDLIQSAADSEAGIFFMDGSGNAVFHDRDHRAVAPRSTTTQAVFGDGGDPSGELPYVTLSPDFDINRVWNDIQVTPGFSGAIPQLADDTTSQLAYGIRTLARTTQLIDNLSAQGQAARILKDNKDPHLRFPTMTVEPLRNAALWPVVLGSELSDRFQVIRRPYAGGAAISRLCWVEGIQHDIQITPTFTWTTTFSLSLADPTIYWTLGVSGKSELDTATFLR